MEKDSVHNSVPVRFCLDPLNALLRLWLDSKSELMNEDTDECYDVNRDKVLSETRETKLTVEHFTIDAPVRRNQRANAFFFPSCRLAFDGAVGLR